MDDLVLIDDRVRVRRVLIPDHEEWLFAAWLGTPFGGLASSKG
ncbi:hypothetical protein ACFY2J_09035 [Streptomyces collinus]